MRAAVSLRCVFRTRIPSSTAHARIEKMAGGRSLQAHRLSLSACSYRRAIYDLSTSPVKSDVDVLTPLRRCLALSSNRSSALLEALRKKKDFVGGTVGGGLAGMAYGVSGEIACLVLHGTRTF